MLHMKYFSNLDISRNFYYNSITIIFFLIVFLNTRFVILYIIWLGNCEANYML